MARVSRWDLGDKNMAELIGQLWHGFSLLQGRKEIQKFLSKFFTPTEIQMLAKRLELLKLADTDLEVTQIQKLLGLSRVMIYEWISKHDAYEEDFNIILERIKSLDKTYLDRLKARVMRDEKIPSILSVGGELIRLGDKPEITGYKKRKKRLITLTAAK